RELIEILRRNLRPEIRHEILNITVGSISRLREICRKRECFLEELKREQVYKKGPPFKSHVSELLGNTREEDEPEFFEELDGAVEAISLVCWNCRKEGHRYQDCTASRKVCVDTRPYAIVRVLDREVKGLMDTGAAMSCIGGRFAKEILGNGMPVRRVFSNVSTADCSKQNIVGRIKTGIEIQRFWREVQTCRQKLVSAIFLNSDNRLYPEIEIEKNLYVALLDSGASISCIGGRAAKELATQSKMLKCSGRIRTANDAQCNVTGRIRTEIAYRDLK
ncbi:hypothetical protein KR067_013070, partial [Drosophila pandora]